MSDLIILCKKSSLIFTVIFLDLGESHNLPNQSICKMLRFDVYCKLPIAKGCTTSRESSA